ncbi:MAG: hypothetical protein N2606_06560 [Candidatus Omnitrophica bacterium]|nr:hypothetical protein [Candidatus Omnitrophota bacterium]
MITPLAMDLVCFVVLRQHQEQIAQQLVELGFFHPVDIVNIEEKIRGLTPAQVEKESHEIEHLEAKIREISHKLNLTSGYTSSQQLQQLSLSDIQQKLDAISKELEPLLEDKKRLQEELSANRTILSQIKEYFPQKLSLSGPYSFLFVSCGQIEERNLGMLERSLIDLPHVVYPFRKDGTKITCLFIGLRRDKNLLLKVLGDVAWQEVELPQDSQRLSEESRSQIEEKINQIRKNISITEGKINNLAQHYSDQLRQLSSYLKLKKSLLEAKRFSSTTETSAVFAGWVPRDKREEIIRKIKSLTDVVYLETHQADTLPIPKEEIPVCLKHNSFLKPFELLLESYGLPRYGTIDPTVFVAISFLIMFGAMFGDIGHGLVLALVGLLILLKPVNSWWLKYFKRKPNPQIGTLLLYSGISAMVFGFLYGSVFGFEFDSIWIKPMKDIMGIFKAGIFLGIFLVSLGIILNIINALRDKNYLKAVFDKAGLIGGLVYWLAIGLISKRFFHNTEIPLIYYYFIFTGILLLFLYPIFESLFIKRHSAIFESFMEGMVTIMEILTGYLSNTVSFIRVAAFALAHAGLFLAIFSLSQLTDANTKAGIFISWLVIIIGNILVVLLEGLIVTIQSLRLNYYEFLSKFFVGGKRLYQPLSV